MRLRKRARGSLSATAAKDSSSDGSWKKECQGEGTDNERGGRDLPSVAAVRAHYGEKAAPVLQAITEYLLQETPGDIETAVLSYLTRSSSHTAQSTSDTKLRKETLLCELTGLPAQMKARAVSSRKIAYYTKDVCDALKRKGKLRGWDVVSIDAVFPASCDKHLFSRDSGAESDKLVVTGSCQASKAVLDQCERPATPPYKGFEVTLPGQSYHAVLSIGKEALQRRGDSPRVLSFKPQSTGSSHDNSNAGYKDASLLRKRRLASIKQRQRENTHGIDNKLHPRKRKELNQKRKKDILLGKLQECYHLQQLPAPLGLASVTIDVLEQHFRKVSMRQLPRSKHSENARRLAAATQLLSKK